MKYAKMIQSLKREYQTVYTEKNKLKYFLKKPEQDRKREVQELLRKQHAKQMDICSRIIAGQKKQQQNTKRRRYCESDSSDYNAESIEGNHRNDDDDDQSKIEEKLKK